MNMNKTSTIRLALIGCGEHAETGHAIPLARYRSEYPDAIALVAACDIRIERAQRFCERYGFNASYSNINELLLREQVDGCIAVVPPERISETGILLLNRHIPCVVEKPLGSVFSDVEALAKKAAESGTANMVSVNRRFMPFLNRALEWAGNAGSMRYVHCTLARHARSEREFIWATAVHAVDTLRYIAGEVNNLNLAQSWPVRTPGIPSISIFEAEWMDELMCCPRREWLRRPTISLARVFMPG
jgi:predicted dehydrogenase